MSFHSASERGKLLLRILEDVSSPLAVLHGYQTFPESIPSDVDIIGTKAVLEQLKCLVAAGRYKVVQVIQYESTSYAWIFVAKDTSGRHVYLQIDFSVDYRGDGRIFYRAEELLPHKQIFKGVIPVLPPALEFGYYVVKKIRKGRIEPRHAARLTELYRQDPEGCRKELAKFFPENELEQIVRAAESGDWTPVQTSIRFIRRDMLRKVAVAHPWDVPIFYMGDFYRLVKRILQPAGIVVAFLGMDGSGKTSVIEGVGEALLPIFHRQKIIHLRPSLRAKQYQGPVTNPHGRPPRGFFLSVGKLFYWWAEYAVGWFLSVFPSKVRKALILFDRYYHDLLVDSKRYRYGGPMWLARLATRFVPKPDLFIFLDLPAEVAYSRKPEVPPEEARKLREQYLKLARSLPNSHVVDASRPFAEVVTEVEQIILDYMAERTARRLGLK